MALLTYEQASEFPTSTGNTNFFTLKNDGDSATVRFLYSKVADIPFVGVHNHKVDDGTTYGKQTTVDCLRTSVADAANVCPLCESGSFSVPTAYLNLMDTKDGAVYLWQRSRPYFDKNIYNTLSTYESEGIPLYNVPIKIIRNGAKGDLQTKYNLIALPIKEINKEDLPEITNAYETELIKKLNKEEMITFLNTGNLPNKNNGDAGIQARSIENTNFSNSNNMQQNSGRRTMMMDTEGEI